MKNLGLMLIGFAFAVVSFATCSVDSQVGQVEKAVVDAFGIDVATHDAFADIPVTADCDRTWTVSSNTTLMTYYYAEFKVFGFDPMAPTHITGFTCGWSLSGSGNVPAWAIFVGSCPKGAVCDPYPVGDCGPSWLIPSPPGVVRVGCGYSTKTNGVQPDGQWRATKAYLKVGL